MKTSDMMEDTNFMKFNKDSPRVKRTTSPLTQFQNRTNMQGLNKTYILEQNTNRKNQFGSERNHSPLTNLRLTNRNVPNPF